ncbi:MAG: pyridoxal phosphate-dependent aminotransferase [Gammaproteobacteria bacterium]
MNGVGLSHPLNPRLLGLGPSATVAVNEHCAALQRAGREVFRLGLGQSPFPIPEILVAGLREHAAQKAYQPIRGLEALRVAVAAYHTRTQHIDASPAGVLVGPGSKELLFLLQLAFAGEILIPTPAWVSYAPQAHIVGRNVVTLHTLRQDDWKLTAAQLDAACTAGHARARLLVLNSPNNPTGLAYDAHELEALARVARKHGVVVLSDEIYGELRFDAPHCSIATYYPEATIISGGLSKWCGAGGWRLGTFQFPRALYWLLDAMAVIASETYTAVSAPVQFAAVRAFEDTQELRHYLEVSRWILAGLMQSCRERLVAVGSALAAPQGGFYLFPDFEAQRARLARIGVLRADDLCRRLLDDTGVAILPGSDFGRPVDELTARLALVDFDGARALAAAAAPDARRDVEAFVAQHCAPVLTAVERLAGWIRALPA